MTKKTIGPPKEILEKMMKVLDKHSPGWREPRGDCAVTQDVLAAEAKHGTRHLDLAREQFKKKTMERTAPVKDEIIKLFNEITNEGITDFNSATVKVYHRWPKHKEFPLSLVEIRTVVKGEKE